MTDSCPTPNDSPRPSFNSATFLTSATRLSQCPLDFGVEIAFAGRSNAGKSSAINTITRHNSLAKTSKMPGRTQLINFFPLNRPEWRLVDLPGYGFARVARETIEEWRRNLNDYLNRRLSLKGMVLVMDIRKPLTDFDLMMLDWAENRGVRVLILLSKADKLNFGPARSERLRILKALKAYSVVDDALLFSSPKRTGVDEACVILSRWLTDLGDVELKTLESTDGL